ncbi:MAG: 4-hydroxy-tetrahydrodipicolinate reductase [bacterium]|nr:4-hydroxy-tetrahydrodipicolinate reductase [bacterium]
MISIILHGCGGTMGKSLASAVTKTSDIETKVGIDPIANPNDYIFPVYQSLEDYNYQADVIVDFSVPSALKGLLEYALVKKLPLIIATTGHSEKDLTMIKAYSKHIPIFKAANMSFGINVMVDLIKKTALVFGNHFDIEIIEKHHNLKRDHPSGTAYTLANAINTVFDDSKNLILGRDNKTGLRTEKDIGIHAVRGGTIVGEHEVIFAGKDEVLEIKHSAQSKEVFSQGALQAVRFMTGLPPGLYSMEELINQKNVVTNITTNENEALVSIFGIPSQSQKVTEFFLTLGELDVNLDMISQTTPMEGKINISFSIPKPDVDKVSVTIKKLGSDLSDLQYDILTSIAKITVEGVGMKTQTGVAAQVFKTIAELNIELLAVTTSETKISCVVPAKESFRATSAIQAIFDL